MCRRHPRRDRAAVEVSLVRDDERGDGESAEPAEDARGARSSANGVDADGPVAMVRGRGGERGGGCDLASPPSESTRGPTEGEVVDEEDAVEVGVEDAALDLVLVAAADVPELDEVRAGRAGARVGHVHEADARVDARRALHALVLGVAGEVTHEGGLAAARVPHHRHAHVTHALGRERRRHRGRTRATTRVGRVARGRFEPTAERRDD